MDYLDNLDLSLGDRREARELKEISRQKVMRKLGIVSAQEQRLEAIRRMQETLELEDNSNNDLMQREEAEQRSATRPILFDYELMDQLADSVSTESDPDSIA